MTNKYNLPESFTLDRDPFVIPYQYKKTGVIADLHIPYHNILAINLMIDFFIKEKIDSLLINGDLIDFYMLSKYGHDPRKIGIKAELEITENILDILQEHLKVKIFYKLGNHDERLEKYLIAKAPEIFGIREFHLEILLKCGQRNIDVIDDKRRVMIGGLSVWHGHELNIKSAIVNPARTLYNKVFISSMISHLHVPSQHNEKRGDKHIVGCWSTGHLGDESPDYATVNKWILGFSKVDHEEKEFEVSNYKIINNKVYRT